MRAKLISYEIHTVKGVTRYRESEYMVAMIKHLHLSNTKKRAHPEHLSQYVDHMHDKYRSRLMPVDKS